MQVFSFYQSISLIHMSKAYREDQNPTDFLFTFEGLPTVFQSEPREIFTMLNFSLFSLFSRFSRFPLLKDRGYFSRTEPREMEWATPRLHLSLLLYKKK